MSGHISKADVPDPTSAMSTLDEELGGGGLEDGELEESDVEEGTYVPLARPDNFNPPSLHSMHIQDEVSDSPEESSADSSGSESDGQRRPPRAKRCKLKPRRPAPAPAAAKKKYDIWCTAVQEQVLTEDMVGCDVTRTRKYGVESYDYTIKYRLGENCISKPFDKVTDPCGEDVPVTGNKRTHAERKSVKLRLGKRENLYQDNMDTREPKVLANLVMTEHDPPEDIVNDLADNLKEEKKDLLRKIIEVIGPARAIELYKETKRIEEDGGILIMNGHRRRTPGGVYIFTLKHEPWLTAEMTRAIFQEERAQLSKQRKRRQAATRNHKVQQLKQSLTDSELPALLSRSEVTLVHSTEHGSNPPPSPATDAREGSSDTDTPSNTDAEPAEQPSAPPANQESSKRQAANYDDDDFLEVNCSDEMDMF